MRLFLYSFADPLHLSARDLAELRLALPPEARGAGDGDLLAYSGHGASVPELSFSFARFWLHRARYNLHRVRSRRAPFPRLLCDMAKTHTLVAVDADAAALAETVGLSARLPGSFLSDEVMSGMQEASLGLLEKWMRGSPWRKHWSNDWVREDSHSLHSALLSFTLAERLADSFAAQGLRELVYFRPPVLRPGPRNQANDIHASVFERRFPGVAKPIILPEAPPSGAAADVFVEQHPAESYEEERNLPEGAILFIFVCAEARRHFQVVQATVRAGRRPVILCFYDYLAGGKNDFEAARRLYEPLGTPVVHLPAVTTRSFPPKGATEALRESIHAVTPDAGSLDFLWPHYTESRWPHYEGQYAVWRDMLGRLRPALCIGSTLHTPETTIPLQVAKTLGIPTVGVPHAFGDQVCPWDRLKYMDAVACCTKIQEGLQTVPHAGSPQTASFAEVEMDNQHAFKVRPLPGGRGRKILFLHSPCQHDNTLIWSVDPWRSILLLREIASSVPSSLRGAVRMLHKVHPGINEFGLLQLGHVPVRDILYHKAHLGTLLKDADAVAVISYTGGPLLHSMLAGCPTVILHDRRQGDFYPPRFLRLFEIIKERGLPTAYTAHDFWDIVRPLLSDERYRQHLLDRQKAFAEEQLGQSGTDWPGWLEERIAAGIHPAQRRMPLVPSRPPFFAEPLLPMPPRDQSNLRRAL